MKTFPAIVTGIFVLLAVGAVIVFATFTSINKGNVGTVVIWGSYPHDVFDALLGQLSKTSGAYTNVTYQTVPADALVPQLIQAIASGKGPDLVVFPAKNLIANAAKLQAISYNSVTQRDFKNAYVQAGEIFLTGNGSLGLPFTIDPLVMYWNRSLFSDAGIASPPAYWDEISDMATKLTKADKNGTLVESAVSFGTWQNVAHAKEILISILGQLGNPVVSLTDRGTFQSVLLQKGSAAQTRPADSALRFYTDFADPTKPLYSWNRSESNSHDAFIAGTLAMYFGYASELSGIRAANPNLNFDVAPLPTIRGGGVGGYAEVTALAIPRGAQNPSGALLVAEALTSQSSQTTVTAALNLPSVRRDVSIANANDAYSSVFQNAALSSFSFLDPDPAATDSIFERMVDNISSGKLQVSEAVNNGDQELRALLGM